MRIAFFGASLVSAFHNGAATYFRGILRALADHGHTIRFYEPINEERLTHRDILDPDWAQLVRFTPDGEGVEAALDSAADADLIIKSSGVGVFDDLLDAAVPHCTAEHALSVYWDLEPATTLARLDSEVHHPLRSQLPSYDLVLLRYGGEDALEAFQRVGARTCFPVYPALDAEFHFPVVPPSAPMPGFAYLAHRRMERDAQVQRAFFDVAASLPGYRFMLGGCGWEDVAMPANVHYVGYVYTAEHNAYNCTANAVLNLTYTPTARLGYAPTARLFEAAGAGACVISDAWAGIETFLEPEREILIAHDTAEVINHLSALSPDRAAAIGRRAGERSRVEHTYERRAAELEALLEGFDRHWVSKTAL
jgi:spore maturation protein CgeB